MKIFIISILSSILSTSLCWKYPGYPGVDCLTAREKMLAQKNVRWIIPACLEDGTFVDLQCYEKHPDVCMCVAADGTPLTLPSLGLKVKTCSCYMAQYSIFEHNPRAEMPKCAKDGSYKPLQCSQASGKCWCVDRDGNVLVPPSKDLHSCEN